MSEENSKYTLQSKVRKATRVNPRQIVIFAQKKTGKTEALTKLDDNLILDFDGSCGYYDAMYEEVNTIEDLDNILRALRDDDRKYKFITIDTVTALKEKILNQMAVRTYNKEEGKTEALDFDVDKLAYGKGQVYKREALFKLMQFLEKYCETLIIVGHVADKSVTTTGQTIKELNLDGKLKDILALRVDAIGYMYRSPNEKDTNILSFNHSEEVIGGSRSRHLRNKEFTISKLVNDELETFWNDVFI